MTPEQLLQHHDAGTLWPSASGLEPSLAYARALAVRALRVARGERPAGYKIGFTNRGIWPRYNVAGPIWGTVYDSSLQLCDGEGTLSLAGISQPRIEPECVFAMAATPPADPSLDHLFACIDWVAPGFEIVQSHRPGWKFTAGDTVADGALHARLVVGARRAAHSVAADASAFEAQLAAAGVALLRDGTPVEGGRGANVLDGPLHALQHFLQTLRQCPGAPDLLPGDVVTTGTWTDAWPVAAGERWQARFDPPLAPLALCCTA